MKWLSKILSKNYSRQIEVDQLGDLSFINQSNVNLVYFKRNADEDIEMFAQVLIQNAFPGINQVVSSATVVEIVNNSLNAFGAHTPGKAKIAKDIIEIVKEFLEITGCPSVRLILKVVSDNACSKFHTDAYHLRLLCTYVGRGTEWVNDKYINRKKLTTGTNEQIVKDLSRIQTMQPFEVAILKGQGSLKHKTMAIVHRSPRIEGVHQKRLLLRLDFNC